MKILLSYFAPFDGYSTNSSALAAQALSKDWRSGSQLETIELPVTFSSSWENLQAKIECFIPDVVVALGQAEGRDKIAIERVALNLMDASIPDNEGEQPREIPCITSAPAAYFSTLPLSKMRELAEAQLLPVALSNTAGTYVCNCLMYKLMHFASQHGVPAGFLHIPLLPEQQKENANHPTLELSKVVTSLRALLLLLEKE